MATLAAGGVQMAATRSRISSSGRMLMSSAAILGGDVKATCQTKFVSSSHISSVKPLCQSFMSAPLKFTSVVTRAMSGETEKEVASGLPIDLRGKGSIVFLLIFLYSIRFLCYLFTYFIAWLNLHEPTFA